MSLSRIRAELEAATPGPWVGVIKPNGKGAGLVGAKAKRGMGEQGCIAVVNSIPGGPERIANTKLIVAAVNALPALLDVAEAAQQVLYWIGNMPSNDAIWEGANTEHNQVYNTPGQPWRDKSDETKRHWFDHVGPAIRAAFREEMRLASPPFHPLQKLRRGLDNLNPQGEPE